MKQAIVFGIGDNFISRRVWLRKHFEIVALADNSDAKQGMVIDGLKIKALAEAVARPFDLVIVTPAEGGMMAEQLLRAGVPEEKIVFLTEIAPGTGADRLKIAFLISGELTDRLFAMNYIWFFRKKFILPRDILDIFPDGNEEKRAEFDGKKYQLVIRVERYPEVIKEDLPTLAKISPELSDYVQQCQRFQLLNDRYYEKDFGYEGQDSALEMLKGRRRIQQPDLYGLLGMGEDYGYPLPTVKAEEECLTDYGVCGRRFVTFCQDTGQPVKSWSKEKFKEVIEWLSREYPEFLIIEITDAIEIEDRKILLKNSTLHIDTDSENVHLRHALHGGLSVVLFGPTPAEFYGYSENCNLVGKGCGHFCEGAAQGWERRCLAGGAEPACMDSITVEMVKHRMKKILGEPK